MGVRKRVFACLPLALLVASCALGPDFHRPALPSPTLGTPDHTVGSTTHGGASQTFVQDMDIPGQWWTLLHCDKLNTLVSEALANSPSLQAAQAAIAQSRESLSADRSRVLYPSVDVRGGAARERISGAQLGKPGSGFDMTLLNASVNVSYNISAFGAGARRELEALQAQVDFQRYQLRAAYLTLTGNLVTSAIQEAALEDQIAATEAIIHDQQYLLDIANQQFKNGAVSRTAVLAQQVQLASTQASLPSLRQALERTRTQLAVLAGKLPGDVSVPVFGLADFTLPMRVPVSLPSRLAEQRPDILAAEQQLRAASAQIGVATAALYPQISLSANYGGQSSKLGDLLKPGNAVWGLTGGVLQPIFNAGALQAQRRAAVDAFDAAAAQYRETVLLAFGNVSDALKALQNDADALQAQTQALDAARQALDINRQQLKNGAVSNLVVIDAERQYQQSRIAETQATAARYADTAALFQALGGGWWNHQDAFKEGEKQ